MPEGTVTIEQEKDIVDNFAGGSDDRIPAGLGGEKTPPVAPEPKPDSQDEPETPKGEEIPPEKEQPEPEGESPQFHPTLLQMAGFKSADEAVKSGFPDQAALMAAVKWRGEMFAPTVQPPKPPQPTAPTVAPVSPPAAPPEDTEIDFEPFKAPDLPDGYEYDKETLDLIEAQNKHFADQMKKVVSKLTPQVRRLRQTYDSLVGQQMAAQQQQYVEHFDQAIAELGEEWEDVFGKGTGYDLLRESTLNPDAAAALTHRNILASAVEAIRQANRQRGLTPMDLTQEIHWALMQRYPDRFNNMLQRPASPAQGREGAQASRPTSRKNTAATQDERTLRAVNEMLRRKGHPGIEINPPEDELGGEF